LPEPIQRPSRNKIVESVRVVTGLLRSWIAAADWKSAFRKALGFGTNLELCRRKTRQTRTPGNR
jgi:hypothetical protein